LTGNVNYGFPLKKLKSRIEIGTGTTLGKSVTYINAQRNNITNTSFGPNIAYDFNLAEKLDIRATARLNFSNSKYSLQQDADNNYLQQRYGFEMVNYFPVRSQ
jgi:hypothetical protein